MDKNKFILPVSILLGCLILGGSYYLVEQNKQESIERQQNFKAEENIKAIELKKEQDDLKKESQENKLLDCFATAQDDFHMLWDGTCTNGFGKWINNCQGEETEGCLECILPDIESKRLNTILENKRDDCFKQYPQS